MLERDDFSRRYREGASISLREFIYPLAQAYDSVRMKCDVELGGTDQTFNILLGRDFQKRHGQSPQVGVFLPILEGTDGERKMSKSLGNYIGLDESPGDIYGKVMSISDDLMWRYHLLLGFWSEEETEKLRTLHPMDAKKALAREIVSWLHDSESAAEAARDFETMFSRRSFPENAVEKTYRSSSRRVVDLVFEVSDSLGTRGEAKRLISQGGTRHKRGEVRGPELGFSGCGRSRGKDRKKGVCQGTARLRGRDLVGRPVFSAPKRLQENRKKSLCARNLSAPVRCLADLLFRNIGVGKASEPAGKPSSVKHGHPSEIPVARYLERLPENRGGRPFGNFVPAFSYSSFFRRGLPCLLDRSRSGGLLHHLFTLTEASAPAVFFLLHFPLSRDTWPLASALPREARTFLPREKPRGRP